MHVLIIGAGSIGERHLRNFLRLDNVTCSFAEPSEETRNRVAGAYNVERSYADWREADLSSFDAAVICAPTNLHVPVMTELVDAGLNVLSEKPLSVTTDGIEELKSKIAEKGVTTGVAFCLRHDPLKCEIKNMIDSGKVGPVLTATQYVGQYWPSRRTPWPPAYAQKRETGGGVILDHMIHVINYLEWILGPVSAVSAFQRHMKLEDVPTEDFGSVTLRFRSGQTATMTACLFQRDAESLLQVVCDRGTMRQDAEKDRIAIFDDKAGEWLKGTAAAIDRDDLFMEQAKHFLDCVAGKAEVRCSVEEAERTLKVVLAAMESSDGNSGFVKVD